MSPKLAGIPTRERILTYLKEHHTASVQVLSRAWRLTPADIRYHLAALVDEGLVDLVQRDPNQPARRGRPAQHYRLSMAAAPDNFPALCAALLRMLLTSTTVEDHTPALRGVAESLAGDAQHRLPPTAPPVQRLNRSVDFLTQHGYRARWEAGPDGPRILLRACPYTAILDQYPQLCQVDLYLLETLTNSSFSHTTRINPQTGSPPACVFNTKTTKETSHLPD